MRTAPWIVCAAVASSGEMCYASINYLHKETKAMFRKCICLLFAALLLAALPVCAAAEDWTDISTPEELAAMTPQGNYRLTADIDMQGIEWKPIPFSGKLDGQGHDIYNLSVWETGAEVRTTFDGNKKPYETVFAGLFSTLENAAVTNLNLIGVDVLTDVPEHCFAAGLAGYISHSEIRNCSVTGKIWMYGNNVMVGVAGIAGFGCGEIHDCSADVELLFADRNTTGTKCEEFMGGTLACGSANISGCRVDIRGYDSCNGYVHNGGQVGMFYHCTLNYPGQQVENCKTYGKITFYENNPDRRAYCAAYIGEALTRPTAYTGNSGSFTRDEIKDFTKELFPETCQAPEYESVRVAPSCASYGFVRHTCKTCGYCYQDSYIPKAHQPGEPEVVEAADYGRSGTARLHCTLCGTLLGEQTIPALVRAESCNLPPALTLHYKDTYKVPVLLQPEDTTNRELIWTSSDAGVLTVAADGTLTAVGRGTAVVTCASADGGAAASCAVSVGYTPVQWIIKILLFGWIWY